MFVVTIPDEMFIFMNKQFVRFQAPYPDERTINETGNYLLEYLTKKDYFPDTPSEAHWRMENPQTGLTILERESILPGLEYRLKVEKRLQIDIDQMHLAAWSALMWCWTPEGEIHVRFNQEAESRSQVIREWERENHIDQVENFFP